MIRHVRLLCIGDLLNSGWLVKVNSCECDKIWQNGTAPVVLLMIQTYSSASDFCQVQFCMDAAIVPSNNFEP